MRSNINSHVRHGLQRTIASILFLSYTLCVSAAQGLPTAQVNDVHDKRSNAYALTHGVIETMPGTRLEDATLLVKDGVIVRVSEGGKVPAGYTEIDLAGRYVYPGLIDIHTNYGMPKLTTSKRSTMSQKEVMDSTVPGAYSPNEAIKSHFNASEAFVPEDKQRDKWRKLGFSSLLTFQPDGVAMGSSALVNLADKTVNESIILPRAATHYNLERDTIKQLYPISRMGSVALLRQTYLDAKWFAAQSPRPFVDHSLEGWIANEKLPKIFSAFNWKTLLLADKIGDEFGDQYVIKGGGDEYQRIDLVKATGATLILPLDFPEPFDVSDPFDAREIPLSDLKHWELAPYNPARLAQAGIPFALTSSNGDKAFWPNLRLAIKNGLDETVALDALTRKPAEILGVNDRLGTLEAGKIANFLVTSGELFDKQTRLQENWIAGERFILDAPHALAEGNYALQVAGQTTDVTVELVKGKYKVSNLAAEKANEDDQSDKPKYQLTVTDDYLGLQIIDATGATRLGAWRTETGWEGTGEDGKGNQVSWSLSPIGGVADAEQDTESDTNEEEAAGPGAVIYPFVAHGWKTKPEQQDILFKHATVWTNESDGVLEDADVLVKDGKIAEVGASLSAAGAVQVDATGMHITPGIIDEHSHIALDAVNEFATNSSMVRMADVLDSEDVAIYRDLAGGVTAAQLLHGSANPIGGQSAIIKMRWGADPQGLLIKDADPFIKFALGENVKRSRNPVSIRYPQTRMGVEQVYVDAFTEARKYEARWNAYNNLSRSAKRKTVAPRRDLAMDTMLEILNGDRFITSHSYVQSEINMLMHVADQFGFGINTFTHILEGYKVADKMVEHGVGGSTFADWWAYKWEVRYAIPYNVALMNQAGVTVAVNSDDAEMSRRLNQEAAKSVKYGGLSEQEALKLVTLNPAKLLHLDDRMGSIKAGKDADLVLWSGHPLSIYSKAEKTLVDGTVYYDAATDLVRREEIQLERARLIEKMRQAKDKSPSSGKDKRPPPTRKWYYHHEDLAEMLSTEMGAAQ